MFPAAFMEDEDGDGDGDGDGDLDGDGDGLLADIVVALLV